MPAGVYARGVLARLSRTGSQSRDRCVPDRCRTGRAISRIRCCEFKRRKCTRGTTRKAEITPRPATQAGARRKKRPADRVKEFCPPVRLREGNKRFGRKRIGLGAEIALREKLVPYDRPKRIVRCALSCDADEYILQSEKTIRTPKYALYYNTDGHLLQSEKTIRTPKYAYTTTPTGTYPSPKKNSPHRQGANYTATPTGVTSPPRDG